MVEVVFDEGALVEVVFDEGALAAAVSDKGALVAGALALGNVLVGKYVGESEEALKVGAVVVTAAVGLDLTTGAQVGDALGEFDGNVVVG